MRRPALRRRILAWPVAVAAVLSLLLQAMLVPGAVSAPAGGLLALGSICHAATEDGGDRAPQPLPGQACDHCLLCHAGNFSAVVPPPVSLLIAPAMAEAAAAWLPAGSKRGAAWRAYASRAPPTIG